MSDDKKTNYELKIIGACLPRTGTLSLKSALEQLGFSQCYHMFEAFQNKDFNFWINLVEKDCKGIDFSQVFSNKYISTVDAPGCFVWEKLLEENPNAKVILTVRDSPEKWLKSCEDTIFKVTFKENRSILHKVCLPFDRELRYAYLMHDAIFHVLWFQRQRYSSELAIQKYNDYIEDVKRKVPKDKLLIFNAKDGWSPLCKFLDVPVPNQEFPHLNDSKEISSRFRSRSIKGGLILAIGSAIVLGGIYLIKKRYFRDFGWFN